MIFQPMGADPPNNQPTENLDGSVGTLLEDAYRTCERIEQTLAEATPTPQPLTEAVDTMAREATQAAQAPAAPATPPAGTPDIDPGIEVGGDLTQLDADLAELAENLLTPASPASAPAPPPSPPPVEAAASVAPVPAPLAAPAPTPPVNRAAPAPHVATPAPTAAPATEQGLPPPQRAAKILVEAASPVVLTTLGVLSKPLRNKPRAVRDSVGWLAIWTLFLAGTLWVYVMFFHEPAGPLATAPALEFIGPDGKQPHAAHGDEHADAAPHEAPPKDAHAKPADDHAEPHKAAEADEHHESGGH